MASRTPVGTVLLVALVNASTALAQASGDAPYAARLELWQGDRVTVTTVDGHRSQGRFAGERADVLVLSAGGREEVFAWTDITRVQRPRNGVVLGALIGIRRRRDRGVSSLHDWSERDRWRGGRAIGMVSAGAAAGIGIDALVSRSRTIYRRDEPSAAVQLEPRRGGGALRLAVTW